MIQNQVNPEAVEPNQPTEASVTESTTTSSSGRANVMASTQANISSLEQVVLSGVPTNSFEYWYLVSRNWNNILFAERQCAGGGVTNDRMRDLLTLKNN